MCRKNGLGEALHNDASKAQGYGKKENGTEKKTVSVVWMIEGVAVGMAS